jgi:pyridoxal phosphate enzyme (YggS family)
LGISENLNDVTSRIRAAALKAGRDPGGIRLVVVSKTVGSEQVMEAVSAGALILGENRVQEAAAKMEALAGRIPAGVEWHLIGTLQKNKAKHAAGVFRLIHSVDSVELAREIDRQAAKRGLVQNVLLELNIAGEASKHGFTPGEAKAAAKEILVLANISLVGLMCVPPFTDNPEDSRPFFVRMRGLLAGINTMGLNLTELSMGMTQDYEVAVEEGATLVRVGTAIFGARS